MDEFGSRIRQSCDPTVSMTTLFYIPLQFAFTILWPIKDLDYGGELSFVGKQLFVYLLLLFCCCQMKPLAIFCQKW